VGVFNTRVVVVEPRNPRKSMEIVDKKGDSFSQPKRSMNKIQIENKKEEKFKMEGKIIIIAEKMKRKRDSIA
jgi:hypothetical protein